MEKLEIIGPSNRMIQSGDQIPCVCLTATTGQTIDIKKASENQHVVLFFYPGDREGLRFPELAGCTAEACSFRDRLHVLHSLKTIVYGVSLQSTERQREFVEREHLNFALLSDEKKELVSQLGIPVWVSGTNDQFVARTTIIIERGGLIAHVFKDVYVVGHVEEVLQIVTSLENKDR